MKTFALLPIVITGLLGSVFLIQIHVPEKADAVVVRVPAEAPPPAQITTVVAAVPIAAPPPTTRGRVAAGRDLDVKSKMAGEVLSVAVDVGDRVKQGQLLIELDSRDAQSQLHRTQAALLISQSRLAQARESLTIAENCVRCQDKRSGACVNSAEAKAQRARIRADRYKQTLKKSVISQEVYDEAEALAVEAAANFEISKVQLEDVKTQEQSLELKRQDVACAEAQVTIDEIALQDAQQRLKDTKIFSSMDGTVTACSVQPGQLVCVGTATGESRLLTLSDLEHLFVYASTSAAQVTQIKIGTHATIKSEACPGAVFSGTVARIAPRGTAGKDVTFEVKIEVTGENKALLKPEMAVNVEFSR